MSVTEVPKVKNKKVQEAQQPQEQVKHTKCMLLISERFALQNILPAKSGYTEGLIIREVARKLALTAEEGVFYGVKDREGGGLEWDPKTASAAAGFQFTEAETGLLAKELKKLDDSAQLPIILISMYEQLVLERNAEPVN